MEAGTMEQERMSREQLQARIARIEGQVHGIGKMIGDSRQCDQILTQILAARAALEKVAAAVVASSMDECLVDVSEETRATLARSVGLLMQV
jgi:DNA-binding FrmR family transcriptional regulator